MHAVSRCVSERKPRPIPNLSALLRAHVRAILVFGPLKAYRYLYRRYDRRNDVQASWRLQGIVGDPPTAGHGSLCAHSPCGVMDACDTAMLRRQTRWQNLTSGETWLRATREMTYAIQSAQAFLGATDNATQGHLRRPSVPF